MLNKVSLQKIISCFLSVMLCLACLQAEQSKVSVVDGQSKDKTLKLAERMESYGYYKSALHYYKLVRLEPKLKR